MTVPFSAMVATSTGTVTFTHTDGTTRSILSSHPGYSRAMALVKEINRIDDPEQEQQLRMDLYEITLPASTVARISCGKVKVEGGKVMYGDKEVHNVVADRILWTLDHDQDATPMVRFLDKLFLNPSYRAVNELFRFMDHNKMGITKDGDVLAYKRVRSDYKDIYSGIFDNSIGAKPTMERNEVDDNPNSACSKGLHVCSMSYLPSYGANPREGNRIVICKVDPANVVSVPIEDGNGKIRVTTYEVVGEVEDKDGDILGRKPVFNSWGDRTFDTAEPVEVTEAGWQRPSEDTVADRVLSIVQTWAEDDVDADIDYLDQHTSIEHISDNWGHLQKLAEALDDEFNVDVSLDTMLEASVSSLARTIEREITPKLNNQNEDE